MKTETLGFIIENAIDREVDSYNLYAGLMQRMQKPEQRLMLKQLADDELKHKQMLEDIENEGIPEIKEIDVEVEITPYDLDAVLGESPAVSDIIRFAIKKEAESYMHYNGISMSLPPGKLKDIFRFLAAQEAVHKARLEKLNVDSSNRFKYLSP